MLIHRNSRFCELSGAPAGLLRVGLPHADILRLQAAAGEFGAVDIEREVVRRMALIHSGASVGTIERTPPDGSRLELRRQPLPGGGFVTLYTDVTARHEAEQRLSQAQKMEAVGQITGGIAHDFNNLLSVITGRLDLAQRALEAQDLPRVQRSIGVAQSAAGSAAGLTSRLLAFARRQTVRPLPTDANEVISGMADLIRHSVGCAIRVETALDGALWACLVDPHLLESALLNLAINARDAMPHGGTLTIRTGNLSLAAEPGTGRLMLLPGDYVAISVADNGEGMTPEVADRALEPFFTTKGKGKGSGLGLAQVAGFAKQAQGHVRIDTGAGMGTTVVLYLPRLDEQGAVPDGHTALDFYCCDWSRESPFRDG